MRTRARAVAAALVVVALLAGCSDGDRAVDSSLGADAIVLLKPGSTDLNALDLRDKLVPLTGVESVVYDQAVKRLRINFTDTATAEQRAAATDAARQDPAVERVREAGRADDVSQAPAPGATGAPAPTP